MTNTVLGSISIVITGDTTSLNAALNSAVQGAQSAGVSISAAMNAPLAGANQLDAAVSQLAAVIREESAAASLAAQRNAAMGAQLNAAAGAANNLGTAGQHGGLGLRYIVFGLKDIAEGRGTFAIAELVNVLIRVGPAAAIAGGSLLAIGAAAYGILKLNEYMKDLPDATRRAAEPFKVLNDDLEKSNDEMQVANDKLADELAKLQGHPKNGLKLALDEAVVSADELNAALHRDIEALQELLTKKEIGPIKGFFTGEVPTTDLRKEIDRFHLDIAESTRLGAEKIREARDAGDKALESNARKALDSSLVTQYKEEIRKLTPELERLETAGIGGMTALEKLNSALTLKGLTSIGKEAPSSSTAVVSQYEQTINNLREQIDSIDQRSDQAKLKPQVDAARIAKEGSDQARALAVARIEAQQKALEDEQQINKRNSDGQIAAAHGLVEVEIAAMVSRKDAAIATAEEELRVAKAKQAAITADQADNKDKRIALILAEGEAQSRGKTGTERDTIRVKTEEKVSSFETQQQEERISAQQAVDSASVRVEVEKTSSARERDFETLRQISQELDREQEAQFAESKLAYEISEIKAKGSGQEADLKAIKEKLVLEREFSTASAHTQQDEITYAVQVSQIEEKARQAKIAGIQRELAQAQAAAKDPDTSDEEKAEQERKAASLQIQIADLQQQSANANYASQTKILDSILAQNQALQAQKTILDALTAWQQIGLGNFANEIAQALVTVPQRLGESLAASIFDKPKKGESKGQEVTQGLVKTGEGLGKDLAGKLLTTVIEKLIATLVPQLAIATLQASVTTANTAAMTALSIALGLNTAALYVDAFTPKFAAGGNPDVSIPFIAGEEGPELIHPRGHALTVVPAGKTQSLLAGYDTFSPAKLPGVPSISAATQGALSSVLSNTHNIGDTVHNYNIYGDRNPRETMRQIADYQKRQTGKFSPANS